MRQNFVFFIGSILVGAFNYIYYPILARMMEPEAYGDVQAMVALFIQLTLFFGVLSQVSVNVVANYKDEDRKQRVIFELEKFAFMISLLILGIGIIFGSYITAFFSFSSAMPFYLLLLVLVATVPLTFRGAFLRAHQRFGLASIANILAAAGKVVFSVLLVWIGWSINGAIAGILIAQLLAFGYTAYKARQLGFVNPEGTRYLGRLHLKFIRPEMKYAAFVFLSSLAIMLLSSIDILVVKHYFDPQTAGEYAGISTVARIIFFVTAPIAQVLLPAVKISNPAAENRKLLLKSLAIITIAGGCIALCFAVLSTTSINILMGPEYLPYASLLPLLSLAMFLVSVVNLIVSYYIALRKYQLLGIIIPGICMTVTLMWASHDSLHNIVMNLIYGSILMLLLCVLWRGMHVIRNWRNYVRVRPKANFNSSPRV